MLSVSPPPSLPLLHHHNRSLIHHGNHRLLFTVRSSSSSSIQEAVEEKTSNEKNLLSSELYSTTPFPSIKAAKRVILVRHGQSTWNEEGRIQGSSDFSVLTKKGEAQAETSRQMLIDDSFDVCFSRSLPSAMPFIEL
jgi:probable phosphoglycerate mutase